MIFSISRNDKIKYLFIPLLKGLLIDIIIVVLMSIYYNGNLILSMKLFIGVFAFQMIFYNIPLSIFYYNYYRKDNDTLLTIENNTKTFIYHKGKTKISFTKEDVEKLILHLPPPLYDRRQSWLHWDEYFYSEIITKNHSFKISCLVINNLKDYIEEEKIERKKVYFPLIKG
ncbi:hypothetical protein [Xanthomarina gelatinilytica]|uniref:hypothetical protein n=1 Tax=Xanthomarina gelatinilytica TaxID=1137281 RepID=UPI003AA8F85A